jgi:hypothetical protein
MKTYEYAIMTNRELWELLKENTGHGQEWAIMAEMAKRVNRYKAYCWHPTKALCDEIKQVFSQYKLNGAGCKTY